MWQQKMVGFTSISGEGKENCYQLQQQSRGRYEKGEVTKCIVALTREI